MGAKDWCPLARFTNAIPVAEHLLATAQGLERVKRIPQSVGSAAGKTRRAEAHRLERDDRRRNVFPGKKRGADVGKTKKGKGTKIMVLIDGHGTPLGVDIASASEAEVNLIEPLLRKRTARRRPRRLIYDKAADSDPLRKRLARQQIDLICPHRKNRKRQRTQDGRKLRRYRRRYKVERTISWLLANRRLMVRHERYAHLFLGFVQLACLFTTIQRF